MTAQKQTAEQFRALHAKGQMLILPNAWDAASARLAEDCGASAVATSSAAVAWSHGYADGEAMAPDVLLGTVKEIIRVVRVPVSVDSEMGYSSDPEMVARFMDQLIDAGAAGMNLEDGAAPPDLLARKIDAVRKHVAARQTDFFINARCDVYLKKLVAPDAALDETLARGQRYRDAGADGFFVPGLTEPAALAKIAGAIDLPLNVLAMTKDSPPVSDLKRAGVRRISAGASTARAAWGAMRRAAVGMLKEERFDALFAEADGCPNFNALMTR
ncbi:MAG: isocitrate lyase/phosphoenolpyruvate mutase family protein [Rhizomicrobium sp.]